jgi:hypothetical protein
MTPADRLTEIRARAEAATPGPWEAVDTREERDYHGFGCGWTVRYPDYGGHYGFTDSDADFIAAAREDVPYLLERVEALEDRLRDSGRVRRVAALEKVAETFRKIIEDGHPCGSEAADEWFAIGCRALAALDALDWIPPTEGADMTIRSTQTNAPIEEVVSAFDQDRGGREDHE